MENRPGIMTPSGRIAGRLSRDYSGECRNYVNRHIAQVGNLLPFLYVRFSVSKIRDTRPGYMVIASGSSLFLAVNRHAMQSFPDVRNRNTFVRSLQETLLPVQLP